MIRYHFDDHDLIFLHKVLSEKSTLRLDTSGPLTPGERDQVLDILIEHQESLQKDLEITRFSYLA